MGKHKKSILKHYAIYKGEQFLFEGNIYDCAEYLGVAVKQCRRMTTPYYKNKCKGNAKIIYPIE